MQNITLICKYTYQIECNLKVNVLLSVRATSFPYHKSELVTLNHDQPKKDILCNGWVIYDIPGFKTYYFFTCSRLSLHKELKVPLWSVATKGWLTISVSHLFFTWTGFTKLVS